LTVSAHQTPAKFIELSKLIMLSVVMALASFVSSCRQQKPADNAATPVLSGPPNTTFPMPPLKAHTERGWILSDGTRARLADYQGKVLVLDFYATWCAPCRKSIPRLNALHQNYGPRGVTIVGLNVGGPDDRIKVGAFAKELNIQYPLGFPDQALTDLFLSDNQEIPQTFVFGPDGQLKGRFIGYADSTGDDVEKMISELVNSHP
jgi:cytochrome c biogenesis protein CcmG/thiol:disulfide interchange protein DsbE